MMSDSSSRLFKKGKVSSSKKNVIKKASVKRKVVEELNNDLPEGQELKKVKQAMQREVNKKLKQMHSLREKQTALKSGKAGLSKKTQGKHEDVTHALPLVASNIQHSHRTFRQAAVIAIGHLLENLDSANSKYVVERGVPFLIKLMSDRSVVVQEAVIPIISKVIDLYPNLVLRGSRLECLIEALIKGLDFRSRVASNACWALVKLGMVDYDAISKTSIGRIEPCTYCLSDYFEAIVTKLLKITERPDGIEEIWKSAYRALFHLVANSPEDCYRVSLRTLTTTLKERQHNFLMEKKLQSTGYVPRHDPYRTDIQSLLCSAVENILKKITPRDVFKASDSIMAALLEILDSFTYQCDFDRFTNAFLLVFKLSQISNKTFLKYMNKCEPHLSLGIKELQVFNEEYDKKVNSDKDIARHALPLVTMKMKHPNWRFRHAAVIAFGILLNNLDSTNFKSVTDDGVRTLIQLMSDPNEDVQETAILMINKVTELYPDTVLSESLLKCLIKALLESLNDKLRVAKSACSALIKLGKAAYFAKSSAGNEEIYTYCLSGHFEGITDKLLEISERLENKGELKKSIYKVLLHLITNSPADCFNFSLRVLTIIIEQRSHILSQETSCISDISINFNSSEMKYLLCSVVHSVLKRMSPGDALELSDVFMAVLLDNLKCFYTHPGLEKFTHALLTASELAKLCGNKFLKYMKELEPHLSFGLKKHGNFNVCSAAIYLVCNISDHLSLEILPYCDNIINLLLNLLLKKTVSNSLKPAILLVFSNILREIESNFWKYLEIVIPGLQEISETTFESNEAEELRFTNDMHETCLVVYSEIILSLKGFQHQPNPEINLIKEHVPHIIAFIARVAQDLRYDEGTLATSTRVLGDLCQSFDRSILLPYLDNDIINGLLREGRYSTVENTKSLATYADRKIKEMKKKASIWQTASTDISKALEMKYFIS